jgi:hypothetical protein
VGLFLRPMGTVSAEKTGWHNLEKGQLPQQKLN